MQQATNIARQMVTRWGMSGAVGPMSLGGQENPYLAGDVAGKPHSEAFAQLVDAETQRILQGNYATAVRVLQDNRHALDALAKAPNEHETLNEDEILKVTGLTRAPALAEEHKNGQAAPPSSVVCRGENRTVSSTTIRPGPQIVRQLEPAQAWVSAS
jgi:Peptidase family M41